VLTPHLGYVTRENYAVFFADVVADIEAWLDGRVERLLTPEP
jgi:phosphoglycerate dehydrogenase-like enzyme